MLTSALISVWTLRFTCCDVSWFIEDQDIYQRSQLRQSVFPWYSLSKCVVIVTSITNNHFYFVPLRWNSSRTQEWSKPVPGPHYVNTSKERINMHKFYILTISCNADSWSKRSMMLTSYAVPPHGGAEGIQHIRKVSDANAKKESS